MRLSGCTDRDPEAVRRRYDRLARIHPAPASAEEVEGAAKRMHAQAARA